MHLLLQAPSRTAWHLPLLIQQLVAFHTMPVNWVMHSLETRHRQSPVQRLTQQMVITIPRAQPAHVRSFLILYSTIKLVNY